VNLRTACNNIFTDHITWIQRDIESKLRLKRYVLNGERFCVDSLRTQADVIKLIDQTVKFFARKLRFRRFRGIRLDYISSGEGISFFRVIVNP
jgi:hypothetical protein